MLLKISSGKKTKLPHPRRTSKAFWNVWKCMEQTADDCGWDTLLVTEADPTANMMANPF